jgi:UDPglucose 6-dehydrogenase
MKITIVGTGYVGLVTGACFAEMGNVVTCVDKDEKKLEQLKLGKIPIYEPGLEPIVKNNMSNGQLKVTSDLAEAMASSEYIFIAVGTPSNEDGSADLQHVLAVAKEIGQHLENYSLVINKSTVPVGTAEKVRATILSELQERGVTVEFDVVSNPEFLKEGDAVADCMRPDRIVVGVDNSRAAEKMRVLYAPYSMNHEKLQVMALRDAELTKYAANAMLATKISFMNEIANLCDFMGVDVEHVRRGIGSDSRIGYSFIYPGAGYGGSCFPKDVKAIISMAKQHNFDPMLLNAVENRNQRQKELLFNKISEFYGGDLSSKHFGIWGLAFKPGTDDMREASSLVLISALVKAGATVTAYDPVAIENTKAILPKEWQTSGKVKFVDYQYDALKGADAMVLMTEWKRFRQ